MKAMKAVVLVTLALPLVARADNAAPGADPIPSHTIAIEEALKGVKGSGALMARIELEQGGKSLGTLACELFEKQTPKTVANFVGLARGVRPYKDPTSGEWVKKPLYNGLTFHRVIPEFMIQGGDPKGDGTGTPGYEFGDEIVDSLKFERGGLLAMANRGPGTNGSQFFVTEKETPWLNGKHTIFGSCDPVELVKKVARLPTGARSAPATPVIMKKVTITRGAAKK